MSVQTRAYYLAEAGKILSLTIELNELLSMIAGLVQEAVSAERCSLVLVDERSEELVFHLALGRKGSNIRPKVGQGIAGWVFESGEPLLVNDVSSEARFSDVVDREVGFETRSVVASPLRRGMRVIGVVEAVNKQAGEGFTEEDLDLLTDLADQFAIAIDNVRAYQRVKRENLQKSILYEMGKVITSSLNLNEVLDLIIDSLRKVVPYDAAGIYLIQPDTQQIEAETIRGYRTEMVERVRLKVGEGIMGWVAKMGKGEVVPDVTCDDRYVEARETTRSEMVAPLLSGGKVMGVFNLESNELNAYNHDDLDLLMAFASQAAVAIENARLHQELLKKNRLEEELSVARRIQQSFLPRMNPIIPGFDISGINVSSEEVGGDGYDFIVMAEGQVGVAIGDVSGKGVPAALLMATFRASLRAEVRNNYGIKDIFRKVNTLMCESTDEISYVTAVYGVLDVGRRMFTYVNAGHNPPILRRSDGRVERLKAGGLVLGFMGDATYEEDVVELKPDDLIVFYTDGVTEAFDLEGREFGDDRLEAVVALHHRLGADAIQREIVSAVKEFIGGEPQDDLTLIVLKVAEPVL